nr:hypothetical protein [Burkholderia pyrrocinia]
MELIDDGAREPLGDPRLALFEDADAEALGADNVVVRPRAPTQAHQNQRRRERHRHEAGGREPERARRAVRRTP